MNAETSLTRHVVGDAPCVLVVDGSRVVRQLIERLLKAELPDCVVIACGSGEEAVARLGEGVVDLVTTALRLPDMDGLELARRVRQSGTQAYIPIVVVSGDVQERLVARALSTDVTDYFDKSLGLEALAAFIRGYVRPSEEIEGKVLYIEDSRVVALATTRVLARHGFDVTHVVSVEAALDHLGNHDDGALGTDLVLTDVNLKGELTGGDLLDRLRSGFGYAKSDLPIVVMTGDDNPANQAALLRAGANDLVHKPIDERLLVTKLRFQLQVSRHQRARALAFE